MISSNPEIHHRLCHNARKLSTLYQASGFRVQGLGLRHAPVDCTSTWCLMRCSMSSLKSTSCWQPYLRTPGRSKKLKRSWHDAGGTPAGRQCIAVGSCLEEVRRSAVKCGIKREEKWWCTRRDLQTSHVPHCFPSTDIISSHFNGDTALNCAPGFVLEL